MTEFTEMEGIARATNKFANQLSKTILHEHDDNLIISPLSVHVVLAMAAHGSRGKTAEQMRSILNIPDEESIGQSGFKALVEMLNKTEEVELRMANKIYIATGLRVKPEYNDLTTKMFLSSSEQVDFSRSPVDAARTINSWCEAQTNSRIKDIVSGDGFDDSTKLVLVNAVYFKGQWQRTFNPSNTKDRPFHLHDKTEKSVPTMFMKRGFWHGSIPELGARFIELPYVGREFSMVIILPNEINGLRDLVNGLPSNIDLIDILKRGSSREVNLYLPKFKIESNLDLGNILKKMGMGDMFSMQADFSGIADERLCVSKVVHKAFIEVNEYGSEAAAATGVEISLRCAMTYSEPPEDFHVDRPFKYVICHRNAKITALFDGVVYDPQFE